MRKIFTLLYCLSFSINLIAQCNLNNITQVNIISLQSETATCTSNGKIHVNVDTNTGGGQYVYEIIAGPVLRLPQSQNTFTTLPEGYYTIRVTGCNGSTHEAGIMVNTSYISFQNSFSLSYTPLQFPNACSNDTTYSIAVKLEFYSEAQFNKLSRPFRWQASQNPNPYTGFNGVPFQVMDGLDTFYAANQNNNPYGVIYDTIQVSQFGNWYIRITDSCENYHTDMISLAPPPAVPVFHTAFELVTLYGSRLGQNGLVWDVAIRDSVNNIYYGTHIKDFYLANNYNGCATYKDYTNTGLCTGLLYGNPDYDNIDLNLLNGPYEITLVNAANSLDTLAKNVVISKPRVGGKDVNGFTSGKELCRISNHLGDTVGGTSAIPYNVAVRMIVKDKCNLVKEYTYAANTPDNMLLSMTTFQNCIDTVSCDTCQRFNNNLNHKNTKLSIDFSGGSTLSGSPGAPFENNTSHDHLPLVIYKLDTLSNQILDSLIVGVLIDTMGNFIQQNFNPVSEMYNGGIEPYYRTLGIEGISCYHSSVNCGLDYLPYYGSFSRNIYHNIYNLGYESYFCNSNLAPDSSNLKRINPFAYIDSLPAGSTVKLKVKSFSGHEDTITYMIPPDINSYCSQPAVIQDSTEFVVEYFKVASCPGEYRLEIKHNSSNWIWNHNYFASNNPELDCMYRFDTLGSVIVYRSMMVVDGPVSTGPYPFALEYNSCGMGTCDFGNNSSSAGTEPHFFVADSAWYFYQQNGCEATACNREFYFAGDSTGNAAGNYRNRRLKAGNYKIKFDRKIYTDECNYYLMPDTVQFSINEQASNPFNYSHTLAVDSNCFGKTISMTSCNKSGDLPANWWTGLQNAPIEYLGKPQLIQKYIFNLLKLNYSIAKENVAALDSIINYAISDSLAIAILGTVNTAVNINNTTIQILAGDTSIQFPLKSKTFGDNQLCNGDISSLFSLSTDTLVLVLNNGVMTDTFTYAQGFSQFNNIFNFMNNATGTDLNKMLMSPANYSTQKIRSAIISYMPYFNVMNNALPSYDSITKDLLPQPKEKYQFFLQFGNAPLFDNLINNPYLPSGCYRFNVYTTSPFTCTDTLITTDSVCIETGEPLKLGNSNGVICQNGDKKIVLSATGGTPTYYFQYKKAGMVDTFSNLLNDTVVILDPLTIPGQEFILRVVDSCGSSYAGYTSLSQFSGKFYIRPDSACIGSQNARLSTMKVPFTQYVWKKNGITLPSDSSILFLSSPFSSSDTGTYKLYTNCLSNCVVDSTELYVNGTLCTFMPLPIQLLSFEGTNHRCITTLKWTDQNSNSIIRYHVERAADADHFVEVGSVQAVPNREQYEFKTEDYNIASYYRLKAMDVDGSVSYSNTIKIMGNCAGSNNLIMVYPNPSESILNVSFESDINQSVQLKLYDFLGKLLWSHNLKALKGKTIYPIEVDSYIPGSYLLHVQIGQESYHIKIQKK